MLTPVLLTPPPSGSSRSRWRRSLGAGAACLAVLAPMAIAAPAWAGSERPRSAPANPSAAAESDERPDFVPGELLVRFDHSGAGAGSRVDAERTIASVGGRVAQSFEDAAPGLRRVVLEAGASVTEAIATLEARSDVLYAEPNYVMSAAAVPNDSRFGELWGLHNRAQSVEGVVGKSDADIDTPEAWNVTTGSANVTVAVIDSGVAYDHPDLAPNMWVNTREVAGNRVDDDRNGYVDDVRGWDFVGNDADPSDEQGHGTHVAGTIGARGNNDVAGGGATDMVGVAWNVRLMPIRVLDHEGIGSYANLLNGINYARANGAQIANMSLGARYDSQALRDAMSAASGVTWIVAAGNEWSDLEIAEQFPCEFDLVNLICVAATDQHDQLANFSNYSVRSVDVAAPGVSTLSTSPYARVFFENFETSITGRWVTGGTPNTWARTTSAPWGETGNWLTDSPAGLYPNSSDNWARTNAVDLRGKRNCVVGFRAYLDTESFYDFVRVEVATNAAGPWTEILAPSGYWPDAMMQARLPASFNGASAAYLRFRLNPDEMYQWDGIYIDDVSLRCSGPYAADSYQYMTGTSMATPHVSGVAALIKARNPSYTTAQLRTKLLASVDKKPTLTGKVVTGGRINAYKAVTG